MTRTTSGIIAFIVVIVLFLVLGRMCLFTVDRTEFVYVTQLGRHVATLDGANDEQAGLHLRWPWPIQTLTRIDRRLQVLDLPAAELVTEDPSKGGSIDKTLAIDAYVVWRIPDAAAVERFILTVGTPEQARINLRDRIRGRLGGAIARKKFTDLVSVDFRHVDEQRELLRNELLPSSQAKDGIEVVDVRLRRLNYPAQVRNAIFDRIKSERNRKAAGYRSEGNTEAQIITSKSEAQVSVAVAEARARNDEKRGKADAQADRILNGAISKDPDYYAELRKREIGDIATAKDSPKVKVWSTQLYRLFFPGLPGEGMKPAAKDGEK
jgi:membrane protease subunit HflC